MKEDKGKKKKKKWRSISAAMCSQIWKHSWVILESEVSLKLFKYII